MDIKTVTFKQALELKELGFPQNDSTHGITTPIYVTGGQECEGIPDEYRISGDPKLMTVDIYNCFYYRGHFCVAPYLSDVAQWLREEKHIYVSVQSHPTKIYKNKTWNRVMMHEYRVDALGESVSNDYFTFSDEKEDYNEALLAGIDEAITYLKQNNK